MGRYIPIVFRQTETLAGLAIRGDGAFSLDTNETTRFAHKDFVIVQSGHGGEVAIQALDSDLRIFLIEVPTEVDYPLYRKRKITLKCL